MSDRCGARLPVDHATLVCGRKAGHDGEHRCTRADGSMTGWNDVPAPAPLPVTADVQRELADGPACACGGPCEHDGSLLRAQVHQALYDLAVDHPMWIDGQGRGLDYSPEREERIADFVDEAADAVQRLIADAEKRAAARALEPVRAMHVAGSSGFCSGCGWTFPCPTAAALDPSGAAEGAGR